MSLDIQADDRRAEPQGGASDAPSCPSSRDRQDRRAPERKTLVLTGATHGIGLATGKLFADAGWRILTCSRHPFDAGRWPWQAAADDHVQIELGDHSAMARAIAELRARLVGAPLHALINNAALSPMGADGSRLSSLTTPVDMWTDVFNVNLLVPLLLAQGLFNELKAGRGSIVNVTSIVGSRVHPFAGTAFATSMAALAGLTREMAHDYGPHGIRVNAIAPGEISSDSRTPGAEARLAPTIPLRRSGRPDEVAQVIYFLCSDAASYVTGEEVQINGGQHV